MRRLAFFFCALTVSAADWNFFRSGPVEVWTNAGEDTARKALATFDQLRWFTAKYLGKSDMTPLWPVRVVITKQTGNSGLKLARDSYAGTVANKQAFPREMARDFLRILLTEDAKPMPDSIEQGLIEALATMDVTNARVELGRVPDKKTRDWARVQLLITDERYATRARVFFSNLQQGSDFDSAYRNAFEKSEAQMEAEVDAYFAAGKFSTLATSGKPLNAERDFHERSGDPTRARILLADATGDKSAYLAVLNAGTKLPDALEGAGQYLEAAQFGSESARCWLALSMIQAEKDPEKARLALRRAMELNPRWGDPHGEYAMLEIYPERRVPILKRATELDPRKTRWWVALAEAQTDLKDYEGAARSWRSAERWAPTDAERASVSTRRKAYEQKRFDMAAADKRREEEEKARELEELRQKAMANIHRAEAKANAGARPPEPGQKVVEWWDGPKPALTVVGTLERIDCAKGPARWVVKAGDGKLHQLLVADPSKVAILGAGEVDLGCGVQKPVRRVKVEAGSKNEVMTVEFLR